MSITLERDKCVSEGVVTVGRDTSRRHVDEGLSCVTSEMKTMRLISSESCVSSLPRG